MIQLIIFFHKLSTNPVKAEKIKNNYPDLVRKQKKKGIIFNLDNEEGTITILRNRNKNTLLRLIINNQNGENHFLIDGYDKIVANLNKKNPTILPPKLRYMTSTEINSSGVKQYIEIAGRKISDYTQYLKSFDNGIKPSITTVPNANESLKKILTIFEGKGENLPDNLRLLVSPNNNKVLAFNLKTSDGGELKVSKKVSSEYKEDLRYLSFEETLPDGAKKFLSIDLLTNDFLKTGLKGKPVVINDKVLSYTPAELKEYGIKNSFNRYISDIYSQTSDTPGKTKEVEILENKKVKEISLDEVEDNNLNKQLDNEILQTKEDDISSLKTDELEDKLKKIKLEASIKAETDAKIFADEYFKVFLAKFKENISEKLADFTQKVNELFKQI